jgi:hypothetical protein
MLMQLLLVAQETPPESDQVVAGSTAFWLIIVMFVAVGLLGWSLARQLKKADRAKKRGVYGEVDTPGESTEAGEGTDK